MSVDLERFPWSDSANRMLTYVTKGWYDKSYVGKWIYEVMGREIDLATAHIEELPYQMFINTATWGLKYHEIKYGLPVREDLSYEERRRLLREKKDTKAPMTPLRMEQILKGVTDYDVQVHDCNEPAHYFSHPNIFSVQLEGEPEIELGKVKSKIDKLKQSHTIYILSIILMLVEGTEAFRQKVRYHSDFVWWENSLDGFYHMNGITTLGHWYPTKIRPVYPFVIDSLETFTENYICYKLPRMYQNNEFRSSLHIRSDFVWWEGFLDGILFLDGSKKLNNKYPMEYYVCHRLFIANQDNFVANQCISLPAMINTEKADIRDIQRIIMGWRDGNIILDGSSLLDGSILMDSGEPPYLQAVRIRSPVEHNEEVDIVMIIPSLAAKMDGARKLDGTVKLNSGREVL